MALAPRGSTIIIHTLLGLVIGEAVVVEVYLVNTVLEDGHYVVE